MKIKKSDAAYLAGMLDGEGYLGLTRVGKSYKSRVVIANCNLPLLKHIQGIIGGYICKKTHYNKNACTGYILTVLRLKDWLPQIIPYMVGKGNKATLLIEALSLLDKRKKRTNMAGNDHLERLKEIDILLRKKEWEI